MRTSVYRKAAAAPKWLKRKIIMATVIRELAGRIPPPPPPLALLDFSLFKQRSLVRSELALRFFLVHVQPDRVDVHRHRPEFLHAHPRPHETIIDSCDASRGEKKNAKRRDDLKGKKYGSGGPIDKRYTQWYCGCCGEAQARKQASRL